jgi:hypothetical protein
MQVACRLAGLPVSRWPCRAKRRRLVALEVQLIAMSQSQDTAGGQTPEHEILRANTFGPDQIQGGIDVSSVDGERIGKVKEVGATEFLVDRPLAHDLWVPISVILAVEDRGGTFRRGPTQPTEVVLNISAAHVDSQGWRQA